MTTSTFDHDRPRAGAWRTAFDDAIARTARGDAALVRFAWGLMALTAVFAALAVVDPRLFRGAVVWIKPMKFALSIAVLAATTSFAASALARPWREGRAMSILRGVVIVSGSLELGYIALQAGLGQASHFNGSDPLHAALYTLMGIGALLLTATQPALAVLIARHGDDDTPAALRLALVIGLTLTFVLGAGSGIAMGAGSPPVQGASVPVLGWSFGRGDLRPAHFVGIHAAQVMATFGLWLSARRVVARHAAAALIVEALVWTALFALAVVASFVPVA